MTLFFKQLEAARRLVEHVESPKHCPLALAKELLSLFPAYITEGPAWRALDRPWESGHDNACWSSSPQGALSAWFTAYNQRSPLAVYAGWVRGFDVERFLSDAEETGALECKYFEGEGEILAVSFKGVRLMGKEEIELEFSPWQIRGISVIDHAQEEAA